MRIDNEVSELLVRIKEITISSLEKYIGINYLQRALGSKKRDIIDIDTLRSINQWLDNRIRRLIYVKARFDKIIDIYDNTFKDEKE